MIPETITQIWNYLEFQGTDVGCWIIGKHLGRISLL